MRNEITKLTSNAGEANISSVLSGDSIFVIPYFQREYKWKTEKLNQLNMDIVNIDDEVSDFHFLGAIILHARKGANPSDPSIYEVIDGQQRITTLFIFLAAAIKSLCRYGDYEEAVSLFSKYLIINRSTKIISNYRLHSCKEDRGQLNFIYRDLLSDKKFKEKITTQIIPLHATSGEKGHLTKNYSVALKFFKKQYDKLGRDGGINNIKAAYTIALLKMSVVQIVVDDPTNGPKIFRSLNSQQEPMTIGDLVRNEIFSKVAEVMPEEVETIDQNYWQPFIKVFKAHNKNLFDNYFFPYGLIKDSNLRKSDVYGYLRDTWKAMNKPEEIIEQLKEYQNAFIDIEYGENNQNQTKAIFKKFKDLHLLKIPITTYPFLMQLSNSVRDMNVSESDGLEILEVIESFLVRRALFGLEPTGLHAIFKKLWKDCKENPTPKNVEENIRGHKTVYWPKDDDFIKAIIERPIYDSSTCEYFVTKYNESLGGDIPKNKPWIEHILPQSPDKVWFNIFSKEQHEKLKDLAANLIPLTEEMNRSVSNSAYSKKKIVFSKDSMYKSARELANQYQEWTPEIIKSRGEVLAKWAVSKWKY